MYSTAGNSKAYRLQLLFRFFFLSKRALALSVACNTFFAILVASQYNLTRMIGNVHLSFINIKNGNVSSITENNVVYEPGSPRYDSLKTQFGQVFDQALTDSSRISNPVRFLI